MSSAPAAFPATARLTRSRGDRAGFTLAEMLIVVVMISVLALVAIPRFASASAKRNVESARLRTAAALTTARQAAIQKGQTVTFKIASNRVTVVASGLNLISPVPLDTLYKVTVGNVANPFSVDFSSRGFGNLGSATVVRFSRSGVPDDSLMLSTTGMVSR
jgi:prepilin-type N-terminal cleavage/methylation domain-containing protein